MVKLSIGIPVYNQVDTIAATIESILSQTVVPYEIVVCENHSTDGTKEIVNRYADKLRIVSPPSHLSMAANWNFCVSKCNGDWIGLCSGDDQLLPEYSELMINEISAYPNAVFVMGGWINNFKIEGRKEKKYLMSMAKCVSPPKSIEMLLVGPKASFAAFTFNKSAFESVNGYDETFNLIQDWVLQFDMAFKGSFVRLDALVAEYSISKRDVLESKRNILYVQDYLRFAKIRIKNAIDSGVQSEKVHKAIRKIIRRTLYFIIEKNIDFEILPLSDLEAISEEVGLSKTFKKFKNQKKISNPNKTFVSFLKYHLRRIIGFTNSKIT